jgi:hypothetical protein
MLRFTNGNIHGLDKSNAEVHGLHSKRAETREILRRGWNTSLILSTDKSISAGTFRATQNAGDVKHRHNYAAKGPNQLSSLSFSYVSGKDGTQGDDETTPVSATNVKYVYDSSNFTRYAREKSMNRFIKTNA